MDYSQLVIIRNTIENLDDSHHPEVLRILKDNNVSYTENRNGIFVNLTLVDPKILNSIEKYISFIEKQRKHLDTTEKIKRTYKSKYFENDNKDKDCNVLNVSST